MFSCFNNIFSVINSWFSNNNENESYMNLDEDVTTLEKLMEIIEEKERKITDKQLQPTILLEPKNLFVIGNNRDKIIINYVDKLEKNYDRICMFTDDIKKNRENFSYYLNNMNFTLMQWELEFMRSIYEYQKFINANSLKLNDKETMLLIFDCVNITFDFYNLINEMLVHGNLSGITIIVSLLNNNADYKLNLPLYDYGIVTNKINNDIKFNNENWKTSTFILKEELIQLYSRVINNSDILINLTNKKVWLIGNEVTKDNLEEEIDRHDKVLLEIIENNSSKSKLIKNICSETLSNEYVYLSLILGTFLDN